MKYQRTEKATMLKYMMLLSSELVLTVYLYFFMPLEIIANPYFRQVVKSAGMGAAASIQATRYLENEMGN